MTIALAAIPPSNFWMEAATLAAVAIMITVAVYGSVAIIVKMDDIGLAMAKNGRLGLTRAIGRGLVRGMPGFLKALTVIGTAAMLWVGGGIIVHGTHEIGFDLFYDIAHGAEYAVAAAAGALSGVAGWFTYAAISAVLGLALGVGFAAVQAWLRSSPSACT